jgi:hypothetical protein
VTIAICPQCNHTFDRDESWKRICLNCWIENKRREEGGARKQQRRHDGGFRNQCQQQSPTPAMPTIERHMLRRLILLCHPDKHGNSMVATEVTSWLLKLRD